MTTNTFKATYSKYDAHVPRHSLFPHYNNSTGWPQKIAHVLYAITLPNINRFSINRQNQEQICNNTVTKDPTTPNCVATLPCEMRVS